MTCATGHSCQSYVWWLKDCEINLYLHIFGGFMHQLLYLLLYKCICTPTYHKQTPKTPYTFIYKTVSHNTYGSVPHWQSTRNTYHYNRFKETPNIIIYSKKFPLSIFLFYWYFPLSSWSQMWCHLERWQTYQLTAINFKGDVNNHENRNWQPISSRSGEQSTTKLGKYHVHYCIELCWICERKLKMAYSLQFSTDRFWNYSGQLLGLVSFWVHNGT